MENRLSEHSNIDSEDDIDFWDLCELSHDENDTESESDAIYDDYDMTEPVVSEVATVDLDYKLNLLLADCPNARDRFSFQEIKEMECEIEREIELYMGANILDMQHELFNEALTNHVFCVIFSEWHSAGLFEENDADDIREWIEQICETYFFAGIIPPRQSSVQRSLDDDTNIHDPEELSHKIAKIKSSPQPPQRSQEWYIQRYNMLTASNAVKIFGTEAARNSLIYEKCRPFDVFLEEQRNIAAMNNGTMPLNDTLAMNWGIKYEPVTVAVYEFLFQEKISMFGCIPHPKYSFIGASPDGIVEKTGRMIEIKNIFNREITGIPKDAYWVQMQWQMETCDLDECDFVETRFKEFGSADEFYEKYEKMNTGEEEPKIMGVMVYMRPRGRGMYGTFETTDNQQMAADIKGKYVLMPLSVEISREEIDKWIQTQNLENPNHVVYQIYYWILDEWSCVLVERNRVWFESALPVVEDIWNTIEKERTNGNYMSRAPQKKKNVFVKKDEDNNHTIQGMPKMTGVCLIKLSENYKANDNVQLEHNNTIHTDTRIYSEESNSKIVYMM